MNIFTNKNIIQKIAIVVVMLVIFNFMIPYKANAGFIKDMGLDLLEEVVHTVAALGDVVMGALNHFMLGTEYYVNSSMLDNTDENFSNSESWLSVSNTNFNDIYRIMPAEPKLDGLFWGDWKVPNFLYCPENIFANKIAALDVNFVNPHKFQPIEENGEKAVEKSKSAASSLSEIIASWYKVFRMIAIVGLLIVLVYLGIRIIISSTAVDKAKYKETIKDWLTALVLIAFMHYVMAGILGISETITSKLAKGSKTIVVMHDISEETTESSWKTVFKNSISAGNAGVNIYKVIEKIPETADAFKNIFENLFSDKEIEDDLTEKELEDLIKEIENKPEIQNALISSSSFTFRTNLTGYIRMMAQVNEFGQSVTFTILYVAIIILTCMFTITYLKRLLYVAFFTIISPLVALTYPIDKIRDGKAQAFSMWIKEYTMNVIIQPVHLMLYTVLVNTAMDLAVDNPIYAIVAMSFLLPAEKFIKKLFGLDKAETAGGLGEVAGGALAFAGMKNLVGHFKPKNTNSQKAIEGDNTSEETGKIRTANPIMDKTKPLDRLKAANEKKSMKDKEQGDDQGSVGSNVVNIEKYKEDRQKKTNGENGEKGEVDKKEENGKEDGEIPIENKDNNGVIDVKSTSNENIKRDGEIAIENKDDNIVIDDKSKEDKRSRRERIEDGLINYGGYKTRQLKNKARKTFGKNGRKKMYKVAGKAARKGVGMALGATALGVAAAGAGVAMGDPSKALSATVGGITLGAGIGGSIADRVNQSIDVNKQIFKEGYYDKQELEEKEYEEMYKDFINSEENYQYLKKQGMNNDEAKKFLKSKETKEFLDVGINDIKMIDKARKLKDKENNPYDNSKAVALAQLANEKGKEFAKNPMGREHKEFREALIERGFSTKDAKSTDDDIVTILS